MVKSSRFNRLMRLIVRMEERTNAFKAKIKFPTVKNIIVIASGKGRVKSTIAVNLALALSKTGVKVALVDADIYDASIPLMW